MTTEEALWRLKAILGKGLYPTAIPKVEEILKNLEKDSFESKFQGHHTNQACCKSGIMSPEYPMRSARRSVGSTG